MCIYIAIDIDVYIIFIPYCVRHKKNVTHATFLHTPSSPHLRRPSIRGRSFARKFLPEKEGDMKAAGLVAIFVVVESHQVLNYEKPMVNKPLLNP